MRKIDCKIGTVVELNSGGPPMTVVWMGTRQANCAWLDENMRSHQDYFPYECIKKYSWGENQYEAV